MKKKYEALEIKTVNTEADDVISTSNPFDSEDQPLTGKTPPSL